MSFTDQDLKDLKEAERPVNISASVEDHCGWYELFKTPKVEALIARLEAAEDIAKVYAEDWPNEGISKAWLRSKGESA